MAFCTIVEFEWNADFGRACFEEMMTTANADAQVPQGLMTRIVGVDDSAARIVEVWRSGADAQAFAAESAPVTSRMPAPSRVVGFEVTSYQST
jgi:hypothetical protein